MAATMKVYAHTGSGPSDVNTDVLGPPNVRLKTADDTTIDTNNPIPIPASGHKYSYWKAVTLWANTSPAGKIDNIKLYTDGGGFGTGITTYVGVQTTATYVQATGTPGDTGDEMVASNAQISSRTDVFTYTSGAVFAVTGSISNPTTGRTSNYVVLQMAVADTASPGDLANETFTFRYDET